MERLLLLALAWLLVAPSVLVQGGYLMPEETDEHRRTWMVYRADAAIHGSNMVTPVKDALCLIANSIAPYEPVTMIVQSSELSDAKSRCTHSNIGFVTANSDDFWARDTAPLFVKDDSGLMHAVGLNFNGWGNKQTHDNDKNIASFVADQVGTPFISTSIVGEGGGIEVDGEGTAILTESSWVNTNRNSKSKSEIETELARVLGITKFLWVTGKKGSDITDAHVDFYARFTSPGQVLINIDNDQSSYDYTVTRTTRTELTGKTDAHGRTLNITEMYPPDPYSVRSTYNSSSDWAAGYINYYVFNKAVLVPEFGDATADARALSTLQWAFPGRTVIQLNIDAIAAGGGGIHCSTMHEFNLTPASTSAAGKSAPMFIGVALALLIALGVVWGT